LINTNAKAVKRINDFYATRGSVLLGTEMALNYLNQKVDYTAIASFDSLFAIPDFKIREKIFRLIMQTKGLTKKGFLIQTRNPMDPTIKMALNGELQDFYKIETEDRKMLDYPPFGLFIKITVRGNKNIVTRETEKLSLELKNIKTEATEEELAIPKYKPTIFYSTQEKKGEQNAINTVIKIPHSDWPDPILLSVLKKLPPCFEIKIDPENLL
jgi:primosomal protein N'